MERVKISICGHDFYLKTEEPNRMYDAAETLQKKIDKLSSMASSMSLTDIAMLAALDFADETYDSRKIVETAQRLSQEIQAKLSDADNKTKEFEKQLSVSSQEVASLKNALSETQAELSEAKRQLSAVDTEAEQRLKNENETLKATVNELSEKNRLIEDAWEKLKSDHEKSVEKSGNNQLLLAQIDKLQNTVDTYEKTFDEYANKRNAEVKDLNDELSALRKKYAELSAQMNEIVNDGQMTL